MTEKECVTEIEFLFEDKKRAKEMKADFDGVLALKRSDPERDRQSDGSFFAKTYFPDIADNLDSKSFDVYIMNGVKKYGDKYGFQMLTGDEQTGKIGLWAGICKKYYPNAEVHYFEYNPVWCVCCKWDPDGSIKDANGKYCFELADKWDICTSVNNAEDIKKLTGGEFDSLFKEGDSAEDFASKICRKLNGDGFEVYTSLFAWDINSPEEFGFYYNEPGKEYSCVSTVKEFDFNSVRKIDIDALLKDKGGDKGGK